MLFIEKVDAARNLVNGLYEVYLYGLRGAFYELLMSPQPAAPSHVNHFRETVDKLADTLHGEIKKAVNDEAHKAFVEGLKNADGDDSDMVKEASTAAVAMKKDYLSTLTAQFVADKKHILSIAKRLYSEAPARGEGVGRLLEQSNRLEFKHVDKSDKRWDAARHVSTSLRGLLLDIRNNTVIDSSESSLFVIRHAQAKPGVDGFVFGREPDHVTPGRDAVREFLHPNAKSLVFVLKDSHR